VSFKVSACGLICLLLLSACAGPKPIRKSIVQLKVSPEVRDAALTRDMLLDGFDEDAPARVFGYILLPQGLLNNQEPYAVLPRIIAKLFWTSLAPHRPARTSVPTGITYWLAHQVERKVILQAALDQDWRTLLKHYHVERANLISNRLNLELTQPVLVVATQPLGQVAGEFKRSGKKVVILDLSQVKEDKIGKLLQKVQQEIMEKPSRAQRFWKQKKLYSCFRPFLKEQAEMPIQIKTLE
jgi:hypothetical protein